VWIAGQAVEEEAEIWEIISSLTLNIPHQHPMGSCAVLLPYVPSKDAPSLASLCWHVLADHQGSAGVISVRALACVAGAAYATRGQ